MNSMKMKMKKKILKISKRKDIEKEFKTMEDAILNCSFQEALISNQKLILKVLLDIRDQAKKIKS